MLATGRGRGYGSRYGNGVGNGYGYGNGNGNGYGYGGGYGNGREQSAATRLLTLNTDIKFYLCQLHTLGG